MFRKLGRWAVRRLKERSTWLTLITVFSTVTGMHISPENADKVLAVGTGVLSTIGIMTEEV